jgi:transcriptional regulator with XRE-family HTH domain
MHPSSTPHEQTVGSVLETARHAAGLSIRELAGLTDMSKSALERLLSDQIERPPADRLVRLARVLELNAADLFLLAGLPLPEKLPSLDVMLRTEYGLPPEAIAEAKRDIGRIIEKYDGGAATAHQH